MRMLAQSRGRQVLAWISLVGLLAAPGWAAGKTKKQQALVMFEQAEKMREALNGQTAAERSKREYQRVMDAYRRVYYTSPASTKADASVVAVAELLAEVGRATNDDKTLRAAIGQYEFLRREYPGSKYRVDALFTIGQIAKEDLDDKAKAKEAFEEFLKRYPHNRLAQDAKDAIAELDVPPAPKKKDAAKETLRVSQERSSEKLPAPAPGPVSSKTNRPLVTGIRHWSTPDYTRVAIDLEAEVKYEAGRVPDPDRIFFDLQDTKLASTLVGKTFDVSDGFLKKIRISQYEKGVTRVVLDVDDVSDYSAFLLPNPYRLIIDIHGRQPQRSVAKKTEPKNEVKPKQALQEAEQAKIPDKKIEKPAEKTSEPVALAKNTPPEVRTAAKETPQTAASEKKTADAGVKKIIVEADDEPSAKSDKNAGKTEKPIAKPSEIDNQSTDSSKTELAKLNAPAVKATEKPTSEPIAESVAPRGKKKAPKKIPEEKIHSARPTANGERSLVRALGLKIGTIVVDAGHGGHDTGTIGPSGLLEKDLTLDVALRLGKMLENRLGANVIYTRDDDTFVPLETRTAIANQQQADLFISIHANSSNDASARGVETYYLNFTSSTDALEVAARENAVSDKSIHELQDLVKKIALKDKIEESREFAADVQKSLHSGLAARAPAIRDRGVKKAPFIVLIGANMPSILAEISFLSNPTDERRLQTPEYRQKVAESLYKGISKYVSGLSGIKVATTKTNPEPGQ
jgi:N-acetylmuramoyl-L-alanine amidase